MYHETQPSISSMYYSLLEAETLLDGLEQKPDCDRAHFKMGALWSEMAEWLNYHKWPVFVDYSKDSDLHHSDLEKKARSAWGSCAVAKDILGDRGLRNRHYDLYETAQYVKKARGYAEILLKETAKYVIRPTAYDVSFVIEGLERHRKRVEAVQEPEDTPAHTAFHAYAYARGCREFFEGGPRDGENAIARDLGFTDRLHFREWVFTNPDIWGNKNPSEVHWGDGTNLGGVIAHMTEVRDRLSTKPVRVKLSYLRRIN